MDGDGALAERPWNVPLRQCPLLTYLVVAWPPGTQGQLSVQTMNAVVQNVVQK